MTQRAFAGGSGLLVFVVTAGLFLPAPAAAGTDSGWFAGLNAGQSKIGDYELEAESDLLDDTDTGVVLFGGYQVLKYFSAGIAYADLGALNASGEAFKGFTDKIEDDGIGIFTTGNLPVGNKVSLFATVGAFRWNQKVTYRSEFEDFDGDISGTSPMLALGVNWDVFTERGIHVNATWYRFTSVGDLNETGHENDIDLISVGVSYLFGR